MMERLFKLLLLNALFRWVERMLVTEFQCSL